MNTGSNYIDNLLKNMNEIDQNRPQPQTATNEDTIIEQNEEIIYLLADIRELIKDSITQSEVEK